MHSAEQIKRQLRTDGYTIIEEYDDSAGEYFADHDHEGDQIVTALEGSIVVRMDNEVHEIILNKPLFIPAKKIHDVTIGENGCKYIVGEKES